MKIQSFLKLIRTRYTNTGKYPKILLGLLILIILTGSSFVYLQNQKTKIQEPTSVAEDSTPTPSAIEENQTNINQDSQATSITPTTKPTTKPAQKQTATPTNNSTTSTSSCNYNLGVATGSVQVNIQAQNGILIGDQTVELQAQTGCNVLVNKSSDVDTRIARQGSPSVNFSTVPPGSYSTRAQYKGSWTDYTNLTVNSGQQTTVTITVSGDTPTNTPTPISKPKPTCYTPGTKPNPPSGPAPLYIQFSGYGISGEAGTMVAYEWDFENNGSWYTDGTTNPQSHTYQNPGTYTVKMRVLASNGEYSDICQTTVTANQ